MGFFVVAAGKQDHLGDEIDAAVLSKLFAFSTGYAQLSTRPEDITPIFFLVEIKMSKDVSVSISDDCSHITCVSKCTKREYTASFVQELNLGCIFELL